MTASVVGPGGSCSVLIIGLFPGWCAIRALCVLAALESRASLAQFSEQTPFSRKDVEDGLIL